MAAEGALKCLARIAPRSSRSEEHTSELRHLGISYAVFCLKKTQNWNRRRSPARRVGRPSRRPCGPRAPRGARRHAQTGQAVLRHGAFVFEFYFFFKDRAPTEIYPLSLPDALPT